MGTNNIMFNPEYMVKPDKGRALLMPTCYGRTNGKVQNGSEFVIHPVHAFILNALCGGNMEQTINCIASDLQAGSCSVRKFVSSLLDKNAMTRIKDRTSGNTYVFPPNTIISVDEQAHREKIDQAAFKINNEMDIRRKRHLTPSNITLMVNNKCMTDCFYCYADKRKPIDCTIPFSRIESLIKEAKSLYVNNFDVIGGEFFLYKEWERLLSVLHRYDYHPYLSTKMPLNENTIKKLSQLGTKELQISLDTLINEHLCAILNVGVSYVERIKKTFELLEKHNIAVYVHTILTCKNDSIEDMKSIFNFICQFSNIKHWKLDVASPSLYKKTPYATIGPHQQNVEEINSFLSQTKAIANFPIRYKKENKTYFSGTDNISKKKAFENRATCSANYSGFFILPDGNVTICEELYWNERFLIGNVNEQSLLDIWNSDKALALYNLSQEKIPEDSRCSQCGIFKDCRQKKGVCWKAVIGVYGKDKWYYPDPLCVE